MVQVGLMISSFSALTSSTPQDSSATIGERRLRIALFTFSYPPFMTGIATGAHSRVKALLALGHEVFLIHPLADRQFAQEIHQRPMNGLEEFADNPRFTSSMYPTKPHPFFRCHPEPRSHRHWSDTALLERFRPDVILVDEAAGMRGFTSVFLGGYGRALGADYSARIGVPAVALFETDWLSYSQRYFGRWLAAALRPILVPVIRQFHGQYASTLFPSQVLLEKYRHNGVVPSEYVAFHGVDCSQFHPDCRRHDPVPDVQRPTLLFVGRMAREKSITELFDVIRHVRQEIPTAHLVIVGGGPEAERIRSMAAQHAPYCTFWGESFGDQLKGWYARADVFVNASTTENFCTTNLEALACGTPLIAAEGGGNSEQIVQGRNGYLVPAHNPEAMAARAIEILRSPELRQTMSRHAREFALQFDLLECGKRLQTVLYRLVAETPSAAVSCRESSSGDVIGAPELGMATPS